MPGPGSKRERLPVCLADMDSPRVIHVRLFRRRFWKAFERKGVEPFYLEKAHAISYAEQRGRLSKATVRIYDEAGMDRTRNSAAG